MKHLLEYLNDYYYDSLVINEVCNLIAEDEMVNESFKSSIVQKLAQAIYNAEKTSNKKKVAQAKAYDEVQGTEYGKHDPRIVSFTSIFGPKTVNGRYGGSTKGIQGLKWSEITDDDFIEYAPNDKELIKLIKKTYGKKNANADFIVMKDDEIINFIKAYGADEKSDGMFYFKSDSLKKYANGSEYTVPGGVEEITKPYYSYQHRPLKVAEVVNALKELSSIKGVKVYALEITDDMIKQYQSLITDRKKSQEGVINYDKRSLDMLRKQQVSRYKALADEIRANKLQKDPNVLFNEITETNKQVVELYKKIMSSTDYLDKYFELGRLMDYVSRAYESFYKSIKYKRSSDKGRERYKARAAERGKKFDPKEYDEFDYDKEYAQSSINDAKKYINNVKEMIKEIEAQL